jgi:predicted RNase H-like HicB family nuclease
MATTDCAIVIEKLPSGAFRASAPQWPDCSAVAPTEEEARRAVEEAIGYLARRLAERPRSPEARR